MLEDDRPPKAADNVWLAVTLTARELSVLTLIVGGATNRDTAVALGISPRTVEFHRSNIMHKYSAKNVVDLMRILERKDSDRSHVV